MSLNTPPPVAPSRPPGRRRARPPTAAATIATLFAGAALLALLHAGGVSAQEPGAAPAAPAAPDAASPDAATASGGATSGGATGTEATPSPSDPKPIVYPKWETVPPGGHLGYNQRANLIQRGRGVYLKYCVGCHGPDGDGKGVAAARLITKPRDFTSGVFKFRSTDSGSLPLEADLYRTITRGLSRVSMPAFPLMPETEKLAVIEYVKSFYPRWDDE